VRNRERNDDEHGRRVTTARVESAKGKRARRAAGEVQYNVVQADDRGIIAKWKKHPCRASQTLGW
jgi:hypothetical protein